MLAFPDRHLALQALEGFAAGSVGGLSVGRGDGDDDARLADGNLAEAMDDRGSHLARRLEIVDDPAELRFGHGAVGGVGQLVDRAPAVVVAHRAEEEEHGSRTRPGDGTLDRGDVDRLVDEGGALHARRRRDRNVGRAARDRRQEGNLGALDEAGVAPHELPVDGDGEARPEGLEIGIELDESDAEIGEGGTGGELELDRLGSEDVAGGGEGEDMNSHRRYFTRS